MSTNNVDTFFIIPMKTTIRYAKIITVLIDKNYLWKKSLAYSC